MPQSNIDLFESELTKKEMYDLSYKAPEQLSMFGWWINFCRAWTRINQLYKNICYCLESAQDGERTDGENLCYVIDLLNDILTRWNGDEISSL